MNGTSLTRCVSRLAKSTGYTKLRSYGSGPYSSSVASGLGGGGAVYEFVKDILEYSNLRELEGSLSGSKEHHSLYSVRNHQCIGQQYKFEFVTHPIALRDRRYYTSTISDGKLES